MVHLCSLPFSLPLCDTILPYLLTYIAHPHFECIIHRIIILMACNHLYQCIYKAYPYFSLKNLGKKYTLYIAKYSTFG